MFNGLPGCFSAPRLISRNESIRQIATLFDSVANDVVR